MSGAHEKLEHAEHATHSHGSGGKIFGITMALIGVLIAVCGALVGAQRNDLTRSMIEQTQAHADYTAASTKFRLVMIELEKQRARVISAKDPAGGVSPVQRFIELAMDYTKERAYSKNWADSYEPVVSAHFDAAESYEHAQLFAEIGIVLASLAVLLNNRTAWGISVVLGLICIVLAGHTYVVTTTRVKAGDKKVKWEEEAYKIIRNTHVGANQDDAILDELDKGGKIRSDIQQAQAREVEKRKGMEISDK